jgi:hypothetical protein
MGPARLPWRFYVGLAVAALLLNLLADWSLAVLPLRPTDQADPASAATPVELRSPTLDSPRLGRPIPTLAAATVAICAGHEEPSYGLVDPCAPPPRSPLDPGP